MEKLSSLFRIQGSYCLFRIHSGSVASQLQFDLSKLTKSKNLLVATVAALKKTPNLITIGNINSLHTNFQDCTLNLQACEIQNCNCATDIVQSIEGIFQFYCKLVRKEVPAPANVANALWLWKQQEWTRRFNLTVLNPHGKITIADPHPKMPDELKVILLCSS